MTLLTAAALTFVVNLATAVFKWMFGKIGQTGTQAVVFVLALVAALFVHFDFFTPGIKEWIITGGAIFSVAVTFYEVVLSKFDFFKGPTV